MDNEQFTIENDKMADWAIEQIKEKEEERDRLISLAQEKIKDLQDKIQEVTDKCEQSTAFLKMSLHSYFANVPHKKTKTQESYQLVSGKLVYKLPSTKINHDDEALIEWLSNTEYVETKKSLKWGEYKKNLQVTDGKVIDTETGEVVEACTIEEVPGKLEIKYY